MMRPDIAELESRYETLKRERDGLEDGIVLVRAQRLLGDIRNAGRYEINQRKRDTLARLATDLGEMIYEISGFYPPTHLGQLPPRLDWLHRLGFRRDPFRYSDVETGPFLQEYYYRVKHFHDVFDVNEPRTTLVFGPPGSGKSSMRNVISQLCRKFNIFPIVYQDFGPLVRKHQEGKRVQVKDHVEQILRVALRDLVKADLVEGLDEEESKM